MAIVISRGDEIAYAFTSDTFKNLGRLAFLRKGAGLAVHHDPGIHANSSNVFDGVRTVGETDLATWFDGPSKVALDEEIISLGKYEYTLTVLSSEALSDDPSEEEDEDAALEESCKPKFAYGR